MKSPQESKTQKEINAEDKKYLVSLGKELVDQFGKKRNYAGNEVIEAHQKITKNDELPILGLCMYSTYEVFNHFYLDRFPDKDPIEVEEEFHIVHELMLELLMDPGTYELMTFDIGILEEASWLDFGEIISNSSEVVGDVVFGIIETIFS